MGHRAEAPREAGIRGRRIPRVALRITLLYVAGAAVWIVASDAVLGALVRDVGLATTLSIAKGLLFVVATGFLLYVLVSRGVGPIAHGAGEHRGRLEEHPSICLSEAALANAHENFPALFRSSPLAILALDRAGRILSWNPAAEAIFGWSEPEVLGRPLPGASGERREGLPAELDRVIEGEALSQVEFRHPRKGGSLVDISVSAAPLRDPGSRPVGAIAVIAEIGRRKSAERELGRLDRALRVLTECRQAVMRASTEIDLVRSVCRIVVEVGGYRLAWVGYAEADASRTVRPVAHCGFEEGYLDSVRISWADDAWGRGPTGTAIRTSRPVTARNLEKEPDYEPWRAEAGRRHYASSIALPLGLTGSPFGALSIYAAEPDAFDDEEVGLLRELASDVAYGIEALRVREEQRRAEEELKHRTAEIQAIFRAFPDLYFRLDATDRILDSQAGHAADLYAPPERFVGRRVPEVLPADVATALEDAIRGARANGFAATEYALSLAGGQKWFEARLVRMVEDQVLVIVRDVTERRRAAEAIRRSAERLEHLQEIDRAILAARSAEDVARASLAQIRQLVPCDHAAVAMRDRETGAARAMALDADTGSFLPESDPLPAAEVLASLEEVRESPSLYCEDLSGVEAPSPAFARAAAEGMRSALLVALHADGEIIGGLSLASRRAAAFEREHLDIATEVAGQMSIALQQERLRDELRRRAAEHERRVEERTAELSAANEELESFSYSVTHDLRAPLRAMEGFARALVEDQGARLGEVGRGHAERIMAAALRLDRIVQDLLRYSRLRRAEIVLKPVALESVVEEVVASRETAIGGAGAEVLVERPLPDVCAHRPTLVQIVENLLDNALKFVPRGVAPKVSIRAGTARGRVLLRVEDNGIGIAPEDRERVFNVFERLHGVETYPGSGIGLAIVRKAAERMGGRCGVESGSGGGSRFWVELAAHDGAPARAAGPTAREEGTTE